MTNEKGNHIIESRQATYWQIFVYSKCKEFANNFLSSINNIMVNGLSIQVTCYTNVNEFIPGVANINNRSIIHFNTTDHNEVEMNSLFDEVRNSASGSKAYIVVWSDNPWRNFSEKFLQSGKINDFRSKTNLLPNRLNHIIYTNIKNHEQFVELEELKSNLEENIVLRTKKLETALKKNSRINTELLQHRIQIEKKNEEINHRNEDLELAFKKSSSQHIKLHKALIQNEEQRKYLEDALEEIKSKNDALKSQNEQREEIQTQRDMALTQRDKIVQQQQEIKDNIQYASRIQQALFPPPDLIEQLLPKNFVLNKPKDIVSGDFYWISQNRGKTIIAVSDCTGHGISGAMMSMLGTAFLNEIVNRNDVTNSSQILDQLRERVITSLHQQISHSIEYSRDGMDIAIIIIDIVDNTLEYSGANNPIYIFRDQELIELKPDKMPIGIHEFFNEPFSTQRINLVENDTIYMFSDGYADQFGGKHDKKLKYHRFKRILSELDQIPYNRRQEKLDNEFNKWRGDNEQIDDVLVLGFNV
jgi:serine phosphatase RsbU (regulator of sigma subunit)